MTAARKSKSRGGKGSKAEADAIAQRILAEKANRVSQEEERVTGIDLAELRIRKYLVIDQINGIYADHHYERLCERPLANYTLGELEHHLENLRNGKFPWKNEL